MKSPVFVIGCPRSGNTLVGNIISKHSKVWIYPELNTVCYIYRKYLSLQKKGMIHESAFKTAVYESLYYYQKKFDFPEDYLDDIVTNGHKEFSLALSCALYQILRKIKPEAEIWGDKTPNNALSLKHACALYPNSKFIYVQRDPRAIVNSLSNQNFWHNTNSHIINAEYILQHRLIYENQKKFLRAENLLEIRYEDVIDHPAKITRNLCDFLCISYEPNMLHEATTETRTTIDFYQRDKAWGRIAAQSSSTELDNSVNDPVNQHLAPLLVQLNYLPNLQSKPLLKFFNLMRLLPYRLVNRVCQLYLGFQHPNFGFVLQKVWQPFGQKPSVRKLNLQHANK